MAKDNGGPAFPQMKLAGDYVMEGLSVRDYFAAKAMQAMLSNPNVIVASAQRGWELSNCNMHGIALEAYTQADAMLAERSKS